MSYRAQGYLDQGDAQRPNVAPFVINIALFKIDVFVVTVPVHIYIYIYINLLYQLLFTSYTSTLPLTECPLVRPRK